MFSGGGHISQRGSVWQFGGVLTPFDPARLNPMDPNALVWNPPSSFTWTDLTRLPYAYTLDPVDFNRNNPSKVGTIVPVDAIDQALLRSYLKLTTPFVNSGFTLSVSTQGSGTIQSNSTGATQPPGTTVQLTAVPAPDWQFSGWSSLVFRGDSNTTGSPLAPVPAPELPFSWNGFTTLPYSYTTHDPTQVPTLLTGSDGAGSGKLVWVETNWLKTSY